MTLYELLKSEQSVLNMPVAYSHFKSEPESREKVKPPYLVYIGSGQDNFKADNTFYWSSNRYQLEYYFAKKDEETERKIERVLLENGYLYEKSEDVYIEDQGVFLIYYSI